MRREDRAESAQSLPRVFDVNVLDPVGELERELRGVEMLMREVAGIELDPEASATIDSVKGLARADEVVRDLGRVHLEPEAHAFGVEHVDDRRPRVGELLVPALD